MIIDKTYTLVSCKDGYLEIHTSSLLGVVYVGYIIPEECLGIFGFYSFLNVIASSLANDVGLMPMDILGSVWELKPYATGVAHT